VAKPTTLNNTACWAFIYNDRGFFGPCPRFCVVDVHVRDVALEVGAIALSAEWLILIYITGEVKKCNQNLYI